MREGERERERQGERGRGEGGTERKRGREGERERNRGRESEREIVQRRAARWITSLLLIEPRVCVRAKFYQFLPLRSYFVSKRPEKKIA